MIEDEDNSTLVKMHKFRENVGFTLYLEDILTHEDQIKLGLYLTQQLLALSYVKTREKANKIHFQSALKLRVNGDQLFGNIQITKKLHSIDFLIYPFPGNQYNSVKNISDLYQYLFLG